MMNSTDSDLGKQPIGEWKAVTSASEAVPGEDESTMPKIDDVRSPSLARREVLPLNSGLVRIRPGVTASFTARPQRVAFRPERVFVSNHGLGDEGSLPWWKIPLRPWCRIRVGAGAADWAIENLSIGNRSQFAQSGALPGDMFSASAIDSFVSFETAQTAMDVTIIVTYLGPFAKGLQFYGSIVGTTVR